MPRITRLFPVPEGYSDWPSALAALREEREMAVTRPHRDRLFTKKHETRRTLAEKAEKAREAARKAAEDARLAGENAKIAAREAERAVKSLETRKKSQNYVFGPEIPKLLDSPPKNLPAAPAAPPPQMISGLDPMSAARMAVLRLKYQQEFGSASLIQGIHDKLPPPHPKQAEIEASGAKRVVINAGRRGGKTTEAARVAIIKMCEGKRVLLASTTQDQADAFWEKCKEWLKDYIDDGTIEKNETRRILTLKATGGRIKVKTASDADTLRGDYADFLVLDECAMLDPDAWNLVGAPMLLDNDGDAWFISTPRRRNWFFNLYQQAKNDETGRWAAFHFSSFSNPHLSAEALAELASELDEDSYKQEILAEFLEGEGAVFRNIHANMTAPLDALATEHAWKGHLVMAGVDWGQQNDYTAISVVCVTCMQELYLERFNQIKWAVQRDRLLTVCKTWGVNLVLAEENSIGSVNIETLRDDDFLNIRGFDTNSVTKGQLIRALSLALERMSVRWLPIQAATIELESYEAKILRITGHVQYGAPSGMHDDTVIARALALHAALNLMPAPAPLVSSGHFITGRAGTPFSMGIDGRISRYAPGSIEAKPGRVRSFVPPGGGIGSTGRRAN